ncbi:Bromodomain-containing protein 8-like protein [Aphelenchoides fujianensis]|nr:Bromodomain-containing protein 8-like protein [Aphelenchoides fujianensis]
MDSDVEMVESTPPAPATPPPSASTADEEARTPNDELPMDVDEPKAEAGETSGFSAAAPKDEVDSANEGSAEPSGDEEAPPVPAWTHAELIALLNAAEDLRLNWSARSKMLYSEFKATRSLEFFSIDECLAKYARLTGESAGKRCGKEMMGWIKTFLKKSVNERHANEEPAKSARVKRLFELTNYSLNGELTDDQLAELIGVDEYYGIAASFDADPTMEDREEWLEADKFSSMLSRDEWKTMKSPDDLLGILRNGTVHDERFWFKHPPEEPEIIERVIEEEAEDLKPSIILPDLVKTADVQVSLVEKKEEKAADVEPTSGEVVKRKRGRPRIHPIEEPPAKQPAPPPPPAAAASPTPAPKVAEPPAALPEPIVLDASPHSPTPSSAGQPLEFRLRHTQTEPVDVVKLAEVAITYGHSTTLPPIPELQPAAEQTPVKRKESVASTATIATTKPKRRSTMNEKQKAAAAAAEAAEEEQRAKEKKQESPPPQLVPFFVDEHLFHQTMPDVQLVKPEQEDDKESVISTTSRKSAGRRSGRNAKKRGKAGGSEALETPPTTRSKRPTSATTPAPAAPATPQAARLVVPTLGTPGPPQYVSPNQKSLLVTAHNLVIAHPKAAPFTNPVNDDLVADYSKVIKKPIDLETIRKYIDENRIKTLSELNDFYMLIRMRKA